VQTLNNSIGKNWIISILSVIYANITRLLVLVVVDGVVVVVVVVVIVVAAERKHNVVLSCRVCYSMWSKPDTCRIFSILSTIRP